MSIFGALMGTSTSERLPSREEYYERAAEARDDFHRRTGGWADPCPYDDFVEAVGPIEWAEKRKRPAKS